jgi:hypothetical protein
MKEDKAYRERINKIIFLCEPNSIVLNIGDVERSPITLSLLGGGCKATTIDIKKGATIRWNL